MLLFLLLDIEQGVVEHGGHLGVFVARVQVDGGARTQSQFLLEAVLFRFEPLHRMLQPVGATLWLVFPWFRVNYGINWAILD